jgi:hypothetical protein
MCGRSHSPGQRSPEPNATAERPHGMGCKLIVLVAAVVTESPGMVHGMDVGGGGGSAASPFSGRYAVRCTSCCV